MVSQRCVLCTTAAGLAMLLNLALMLSLDVESEMVTNPMCTFHRNSCLPRDAVGKAALYMGHDVNDSSNRNVYADARSIALPVLHRTVNETFVVEKLASGRFSYPKPSGFGDWQVRLSVSKPGIKRSAWYLFQPLICRLLLCICHMKWHFFRGFAFGNFQYGHVLHDLLPVLVWMSASYPEAQIVLELDKEGKIEPLLAWFDPDLHRRTTFVKPDAVICAGALFVVVPQHGIKSPHGLRIAALFNHLRVHVLRVQPSHNPTIAVHEVRVPASRSGASTY